MKALNFLSRYLLGILLLAFFGWMLQDYARERLINVDINGLSLHNGCRRCGRPTDRECLCQRAVSPVDEPSDIAFVPDVEISGLGRR